MSRSCAVRTGPKTRNEANVWSLSLSNRFFVADVQSPQSAPLASEVRGTGGGCAKRGDPPPRCCDISLRASVGNDGGVIRRELPGRRLGKCCSAGRFAGPPHARPAFLRTLTLPGAPTSLDGLFCPVGRGSLVRRIGGSAGRLRRVPRRGPRTLVRGCRRRRCIAL
jgi:hypothetical protein